MACMGFNTMRKTRAEGVGCQGTRSSVWVYKLSCVGQKLPEFRGETQQPDVPMHTHNTSTVKVEVFKPPMDYYRS